MANRNTQDHPWSTINLTPEYLEKLRSLVPDKATLERNSYILEPFSSERIQNQTRCKNCKTKIKKKKSLRIAKKRNSGIDTLKSGASEDGSSAETGDTSELPSNGKGDRKDRRRRRRSNPEGSPSNDKSEAKTIAEPGVARVSGPAEWTLAEPEKIDGQAGDRNVEKISHPPEPPKPKCQYHTGNIFRSRDGRVVHKCCMKNIYTPGCCTSESHEPINYPPGFLEKAWSFHPTPKPSPLSPTKREAVAIDCEMGESIYGESEIIRLTMICYFTGEVLIDSIVSPKVKVADCRTRYSGVTFKELKDAVKAGNCIDGNEAAREEIWKHVGPETIVVAHGGDNDLTTLKWIHFNVVDSFLLIPKREGKKKNLKALLHDFLEIRVQNGRRGHDSLEDAFACRELVHWVMTHEDEIRKLEEEEATEAQARKEKTRDADTVLVSQCAVVSE